ncbi:MAG: hypothetical protein KIT36_16990 [Alphaproteobacteria bacterium]|nr:hypothetical protein [Alphaproteobacteria bacterium]
MDGTWPRRILDRRGFVRLLAGLALLPAEALARTPPRSAPPSSRKPAAVAPQARQEITRVLPFRSAPFPYRGPGDDGRTPFFNVVQGGTKRHGRSTGNGEVLWEDTVFSDAGVLLHVPAGFDPAKPARLVVFFHGHGSSIDRVVSDMEITRQVDQAGINGVLVAPQFAREAADSSPGKFWRPGAFARFLDEAALRLTDAAAQNRAERPRVLAALRGAPVFLIAYSGGYKPAAFVLERGGATARIAGTILLDALYDEEERYLRWFAARRGRSFLVSLYTESTAPRQAILMDGLRRRRIAPATELPSALKPGAAIFVNCGSIQRHGRFVLDGPPHDPIRVLLAATKPPPPPPVKKAPPTKRVVAKPTAARPRAAARPAKPRGSR